MVKNSPLLDAQWRLNNCYYIVNKQGRKIKFKQNSTQKTIAIDKSNKKRILKSRQMGVSTGELLRMLDYILFNKNKTAVILAHEQDAIKKLFRIVKRAYDFMDERIKPVLDRGGGSKYELFFPSINSRIYCDLSSRGDTINWLHISEKAFMKDTDNVMATIEAVPLNGIITEETTPKGMNHFYDDWMDEESTYKNFFFPWYTHEEYKINYHDLKKQDLTDDELELMAYAKKTYKINITLAQIAFRRLKQRDLKNKFKQEYPEDDAGCFLTSGENPFRLEIIKPMYDNSPKPIREIEGIKIFEEFDPRQTYIIGADPAEGVGGDNSAAHVFQIKPIKQVASFKSNTLKPSEFADKLIKMSELYTKNLPIQIAVERNNHGHAVLLKLDEYHNYPNLFKFKEDTLGWNTDRISRPLMIDTFIECVESGSIDLLCRETLGECLTLTNNKGKIEASLNKHDDLFISGCIAVQLCIEEVSGLDYSRLGDMIKI